MKKIFYSMIAVALCSCAQSEVDDNTTTPPQPAKNGLKFEVVNDGFTGEDGTRVKYGDYGTDAAYQATFENNDAIGIFAIKTSDAEDGTKMMVADDVGLDKNAMVPVDAAYIVKNAKLTLSKGTWTLTGPNGETDVNFGDADLLFAYAPYDKDKVIGGNDGNDGKPSFIQNTDGWAINPKNNRFFVKNWNDVDNGDINKFKKADQMGAVAQVPANEEDKVTFNMTHMRGMVEVTVDRNVTLTSLSLVIGGTPYTANPYLFTTTSQKVYRVLTTEYRSGFIVKAKITDDTDGTVKNYKKTIDASGPGKCSRLNIPYATLITVSGGKTLDAVLKEKYGDDYAKTLKSLRLAGKLSAADWTTLQGLTNLKKLDMSQLTNTEIPANWMKNATTLRTTLTSLVLPNGLKTIRNHGLTVGDKDPLTKIELPATVETVEDNVFWHCNNLSVRIPEDSNLKSIGSSAFDGLKAVYTDPENVNVLKIPAGVTEIEGSAFWGVKDLKKIIFQSETAPTIGTNAFTNVSAQIYVPKRTGYKGKFPGKTVFVGPVLTVDNYTAVDVDGNPITREGGLYALCDGPQQTYWHSDYNSTHTYDKWGIYIDITLPKAYSNLKLSYTTRHNGNGQLPKKVIIGVATDSGEFTETDVYDATTDETVLPTNANETKELAISATSSYNKVRFGVTRSAITVNPPADTEAKKDANGFYITDETLTKKVKAWFALSELTVYEDTWTE